MGALQPWGCFLELNLKRDSGPTEVARAPLRLQIPVARFRGRIFSGEFRIVREA